MKKYIWEITPPSEEEIPGYSDHHAIIQTLFKLREIATPNEAEKFLYPTSDLLHDSSLLTGISETVTCLLSAIDAKKKICIHGDFDVDGIVSTSILWDYLYRKLGANVSPIIPSRFTEGYGLSEGSIQRMIDEGVDIVITVDCKKKNIDLISAHPEIDFIITDHHSYPIDDEGSLLTLEEPNIKGIIHPQHPDSTYPFDDIAGATVTWKFIDALQNVTSVENFSIDEYLPYVAMATITDIMPLKDENRYIVKTGLELANESMPRGFKHLLASAQKEDDQLQTYHFGYVLGPRLNAAGRLDDAIEGVRLLTTTSDSHAASYAQRLHDLNLERQKMTISLMNEAEDQLENQLTNKLFIVKGTDWPEGIIGLVAGKIQEKYNRPILVTTLTHDGNTIKGSARSPKVFHVTDALRKHDKLLLKYGGHAQAAGFSLSSKDFEEFSKRMVSYANTQLKDEDLLHILKISGELELKDLSFELLDTLELFSPFGNGNPRPLFLFKNLYVFDSKPIGQQKNHQKLLVGDEQNRFTVLGFGMAEKCTDITPGDTIDIAGIPKRNEWNGKVSIQLEMKDFRMSTNLR
ncbi:single-stranded-DNA-specific exonuclease RecJ [Candidatus Dojkabacteria bacterium]|uniref:Single-stranded-DNA-specific exonuclease RecJ n=1 Tax=Candidatus Dojkabacteria bacterium TaxID=2099670 RepID=A0A955L8I7_9BACT|nr:single-stranded-DNA-specific exonuclease RecJ [Candidatus Dojkabacteria bacterium]